MAPSRPPVGEETKARRLEVSAPTRGIPPVRLAAEGGLAGWVQNRSGDVAIHIEGPAALDEFERRLRAELPSLAHVTA